MHYGEGLFVGYRWYTSHLDQPQPLFPFGYGLSYTTFAWGTPRLSGDASWEAGASLPVVIVPVTNTGDRAGSEVVQVYATPPEGLDSPARELVGFAISGDMPMLPDPQDPHGGLIRCGKKRAGRKLDGRYHTEFPSRLQP